MRINSVTKKAIALSFLAALLHVLCAQDAAPRSSPKKATPDFSFGASFGLLTGAAEEIVYVDHISKDKLSQLLWNMSPLVYTGLSADVRVKWFFASAAFKLGIPSKTGVVEDRDWVSEDYRGWLTHYSTHKNQTQTAYMGGIDIGAQFPLKNNFLIKAFVSYDYMHFEWEAMGGSILYPQTQGGHGYYPNTKTVVMTYEQSYHIVSPGVSFYGKFNNYFDAEVSLKLTPLLWYSDKDDHIMRKLLITTDAQGGFFIEPRLTFSFIPTKFLRLEANCAYKAAFGIRADAYYDHYDGSESNFTYKNGSGGAFQAWDVSLTLKRMF